MDAPATLLAEALGGNEAALGRLVDRLTPVIQARVARVLLARRPPGDGGAVRQQVEDLTQEIFLTLFADGARVLRGWSSERGLSLENFVGLVARRRALAILRSGKRNPWREDPTLDGDLDGPEPGSGPEAAVSSREQLRQLLGRLEEELSPLGWHLFDLLLVRERPVEEIGAETGMSRDALYAWRSRLRRLARKLLEEIVSDEAPARRIPGG